MQLGGKILTWFKLEISNQSELTILFAALAKYTWIWFWDGRVQFGLDREMFELSCKFDTPNYSVLQNRTNFFPFVRKISFDLLWTLIGQYKSTDVFG